MDCIQAILDAAGYVDPSGIADGLNAVLYGVQGQWGYAAVSVAAMVPFGDAAKLGKLGLGAGLEPSARQIAKFERMLLDHGTQSVERSQRSIAHRLVEHVEKLVTVREAGGHTSSIEKEITNFRRELEAIRRVLGGE